MRSIRERPDRLFDECVDLGLLTRLHQRGYEVRNARDEGMSGVSDGEHLAYSTRNDWLIISTDTHDYQRLHAIYRNQGMKHGGIMLLPAGPPGRMAVRAAMMLDWIGILPDYRGELFGWNTFQQRLIRGERLPGYTEAEVRYALGRTPLP